MEAEALPGFSATCKDEAETPACSTDSDCSPTTFNSDLDSLASPLLESDRFSLSPSSSDSWGAPVDPGSPPPRSLPATTSKGPSRKRPRLETSTPVPAAVKQEPAAPPTPRLADPSCLHKLRYFRRMPVHHLLRVARDEDGRERTRTWPIPSRKLDLVRTTMEESFPEGTLQFLTDFVTPRHYPPCKITTYLVQQILLGPHHWGILKDAYTLLMKIQTLHPASTATGIGWDWPLLRHIMEDEVGPSIPSLQGLALAGEGKQLAGRGTGRGWLPPASSGQGRVVGCSHAGALGRPPIPLSHPPQEKPPGRLLFLQYVVQTLEDDVQLGLRLQRPSMTIAKQVLSCDQSFGNINSQEQPMWPPSNRSELCPRREVIGWLVAAVTGVGFCRPLEQQNAAPPASGASRLQHSSRSPTPSPTEPREDVPPGFLAEKVVLLLQRLLSIAVEVDRSPNCSARKIADAIFPSVLNIPLRSQREALLTTMESQLLRCKLLELLFHHSCEVPTALPLSLAKILYFLSHTSLLLQYEDQEATWQRWDEMLQHLISLLVSYHNVVLEHLWSSLGERMQLITSAPRPQQQEGDDITTLDVQQSIQGFCHQLQQSLGAPLPTSITEKVHMLQVLLLTASRS
ncbi:SUMO-interacting motif-containing protein 1 isoform X2 [Alligator sinensis]|uniref:SUMO-interacting motif-containing protein 1 isoform X2 n=1 Tax=Alligator sinensis TaxID=38654 RepID=A0A3Q0FRZ4_ALLSI|nr:SUMO-interacting motif-containing protein 1 isoform X2 [Alligator sinensis]